MKTIENTKDYKRDLNGSISCVFNHPSLGEIPNGLSQERDAELIAEIEVAGLIEEPSHAEKDAHNATLARDAVIAEIVALDVPAYTLARALAGDTYALELIKESEDKKMLLRERL